MDSKKLSHIWEKRPALLSILFGAIATLLSYAISLQWGGKAFTIWIWFMYPLLLVVSMYLGHRIKRRAWIWGVLMVYSSFLAALVVVPGAGNLFPFEFLFHTLLAIPAAFVGLLGSVTERFSFRN